MRYAFLAGSLAVALLVAAATGLAGRQARQLMRDAVGVVVPASAEKAPEPSRARPEVPEPAPQKPVTSKPAAPKPKPAAKEIVRRAVGTSAPAAAQQYGPPRRIICHQVRAVRRIRGVRYSVVVRHVSVSVRQSFVARHRRHGDTLGRCTTAANRRAHKAKAHVRRWHRPIRLRR